MRQSHQWVNTSSGNPLPPGKKYVAVQLLAKETLYCAVEAKGRVQHVFDQMCSYLGLKDAEFFGLSLLMDGEYLFLDLNIKLSKLAPRTWKSQGNYGVDSLGRPLLTLHLRIQYYVDCPLLVQDKQTRHHYYLQLKSNFLQHCQTCSEERCFLLAAYAMQADLGNYVKGKHGQRYFEPAEYFPSWILARLGETYIVQHVPSIHQDYHGCCKGEAEMAFIREASMPDAPHNLHIYQLKKKKNDLLGSVWLGVCSRGIEIYENGGVHSPAKKLVSMFTWADIRKLCFEKKKFEIRAVTYSDTRKFTYYTGNDEKSKHLLHLCRTTHQFHLAIQPRVQELKRVESEEKKSYRESYIYSDTSDLEWEQEHGPLVMSLRDFNTLSKKVKVVSDQRTSVISNASSTTTSGIVSDRVQSLDGSEDEMDLAQDSSQPPEQSLEAVNFVLQSSLPSEDDSTPPPSGLRVQSPLSFSNSKLQEDMTLPSREDSLTAHVSAVDATDSSSSERSTCTVRSCSSLVKSLSPDVDLLAMAATPHSASMSDTCGSVDHSYTSSVDSSSAHAVSLVGQPPRPSVPPPPPPRQSVAPPLKFASSYDDSDCLSEGELLCNNSADLVRLSPPRCAVNPSVTDTDYFNTCAPPRTVASNARMPSYRDTNSRFHPTSSGNSIPMTCAGLRSNNGLRRNIGAPFHPTPHCRTKIGVSSLSRNMNNVGVSGPVGQRYLLPTPSTATAQSCLSSSSSYVDPMATWLHSEYNKFAMCSRAVSVPNVIGENDCLPPSAAATFPPTASAYRNGYFSKESHPLYRNGLTATSNTKLSKNYHWSVPNFYTKETDLLAHCPDVPIPPPSDFACIPPPPPYRNVRGADGDLDHPTLPPPLGFCQDRGLQTLLPASVVHRSLARSSLPVKAKSEDNILLNGGVPLCFLVNGHSNQSDDTCTIIPPPPPPLKYVHEISSRNAPYRGLSIGLQRSVSSVTNRDELLDFQKLKERSRHLDLPLITALCNDRSLLRLPENCSHRHPAVSDLRRLSYCTPLNTTMRGSSGRPLSWHMDSGFSGIDLGGLVQVPRTTNNNCLKGSSTGSSLLPPGLLNKWSSSLFTSRLVASSEPSIHTAKSFPISTSLAKSRASPGKQTASAWLGNRAPPVPPGSTGLR